MKTDAQKFHYRHELLTNSAYHSEDMLPARYVFILTTRCNLNCSFCFQDKESHRKAMRKDDWMRMTAQLPEYARVTMTGGEPFLFTGFRDVFDFIAERFECNIITNGLLLSEGLIDHLLSYPKFRVLSVSIDNVGNTLRGVRPSRWKKVEEMMRYFIRRRNALHAACNLDVKTTVLDENASELLEIHKYCMEELDCDTHGFQFLKGSPLQHADSMHALEEMFKKTAAPLYQKFAVIVEQLDKIRIYDVKTGKLAFMHPNVASLTSDSPLADIDFLNRPFHIRKDFEPCKYPWSSVHVNPDGNLFPCISIAMGNVYQTKLQDIISGDPFNKFRDVIKSKGTVNGCNRCGWLKRRHHRDPGN
jgi:MoaA/NifB/PqqE/SkfB family radical SAM enzyme